MLMKMKSGLGKTRPELLYGLMALVLCFVATKAQIGSGTLDDRFHHGEYFASLVTILSDKSFIPFFITFM